MNLEQRKNAIRGAFEAFADGNPEPMLNVLDERVQWTIIGTTRYSGLYDGKQDVVSRLLGPIGEVLDGPLRITVDQAFGEGDLMTVQGRGESRTESGNTYNNTYCWVYTWSGDKVVAIMEYLDTEVITASFGR